MFSPDVWNFGSGCGVLCPAVHFKWLFHCVEKCFLCLYKTAVQIIKGIDLAETWGKALAVLAVLFAIPALSASAQASNVCVQETGSCFGSVQQAINSASSGQTVVIVDSSTVYNESIDVNVTDLTLTSSTSTKPVISYAGPDHTISVSARGVSIKNLEVWFRGPMPTTYYTIYVTADNVAIDNNIIVNDGKWLFDHAIASSGSRVSITRNVIRAYGRIVFGSQYDRDNYGVYLSGGSDVTVDRNDIFVNATYGRGIDVHSDYTTITGNNISINGAKDYPIYMASAHNTVRDNLLDTSRSADEDNYGLFMDGSNYNTIESNRIVGWGSNSGRSSCAAFGAGGHGNIGAYLRASSHNVITGNDIKADGCRNSIGWYAHGVKLSSGSRNNTFTNNAIRAFTPEGSNVYDENAIITDNFFINSGTSDVGFSPSSLGKMFIQHFLDVSVESGSYPLAGAEVVVSDSISMEDLENPFSWRSSFTDSAGRAVFAVTEFMTNRTHNTVSGRLYFNNHTANATKSGYGTSAATVNVTGDAAITLSLTDFGITTTTYSSTTTSSVRNKNVEVRVVTASGASSSTNANIDVVSCP